MAVLACALGGAAGSIPSAGESASVEEAAGGPWQGDSAVGLEPAVEGKGRGAGGFHPTEVTTGAFLAG